MLYHSSINVGSLLNVGSAIRYSEQKDFSLQAKVTRSDLESLCKALFERVSGPVDRALEMAQIPLNAIREVLLMGGGTRIPMVQNLLMKVSQK